MSFDFFNKLRFVYYSWLASHRAKSIHPDDISVELSELFDEAREIRVAIIDDVEFHWMDAIRQKGCRVEYFFDYTRPLRQANQKLRPIDFGSYDLVICDIHGVGGQIYPGLDGLGVFEDLRRKNPLQVIVAYTGDPGEIIRRARKKDVVDATFCRDWSPEDFLFNIDEILKIYKTPKHRWGFIAKGLLT